MTFEQRRNIMKAYIGSQFGYCPLFWMFCGRQTNARINHMHGRALRVVFHDEISHIVGLLGRYKPETIHRTNIKILAAKLFQIKYGLSNNIMTNLFCKRSRVGYSLRLQTYFSLLQVKSVNYNLRAWQCFGLKIGIFFLVILKTLEHFDNSHRKLSEGFLRNFLVESVKITYFA